MNLPARLKSTFLRALTPPPDYTVSHWADEYRFLSSEASAEAGKWHTARAEYQRGIMDAIKDHEQVVIMSSAQVGKTEILNNALGFYMHTDPCPMMMVQPTVEMAETWSKDRLAPMLRDTPVLQGLVSRVKSRDSQNTILKKSFPGGHITVSGANSAPSLASRPVRILVCDEVDRFPDSAGSEGDPISLARKRVETFWNRREIFVSTPTIKGSSRIESLFEESDQRKYLVPCPHCQKSQEITWGKIIWRKNDKGEHLPETAHMECEFCQMIIEERDKPWMIANGKWQATAQGGSAGFYINELYSPWVRWSKTVREFLKARRNPLLLMVWTNTSLGLPFEKSEVSLVQDHEFSPHCDFDPQVMPAGAYVITAGVDVQEDRLEIEIVAWGPGEESWSLEYRTIPGSPALGSTWEMLQSELDRTWSNECGTFGIVCTFIDSGGHHTDYVYSFVRPRQANRVFAIKGSSTPGSPIIGRQSTNVRHGVQLVHIGTDTAKDLIYARVTVEDSGAGYMHFPFDRKKAYFDGLTAERPVKKYKRGYVQIVWEKIRSRNEPLDCRVYATAALKMLDVRWKAIVQKYSGMVKAPPALPEAPLHNSALPRPSRQLRQKRGGWLNSWRK